MNSKIICFVVLLLLSWSEPLSAWIIGGSRAAPAHQGHWNITEEVLQEKPFTESFSPKAKDILKERSGHLDHTFLGLVDLFGWWTGLFRLNSEKPNHWEGTPEENQERVESYLAKAIHCANSGEIEKGLAELANALHVGQDRGAHEKNHGTLNGNPDNRDDNPEGWEKAKEETRAILQKFLDGLTEQKRTRLLSSHTKR